MKKYMSIALVLVLLFSLTGCSTSAGKHLSSYVNNVSRIVSSATKSGKTQSKTETTDAVQLDSPTDLTINADGSYSFTGVADASFYLIYFCETTATDDGDDYLYASAPIYETGSGTYSGTFSDLFQTSYGEFLVKVFAFPDITDTTRKMSPSVSAVYTLEGEQSAPVMDYFWNAIDGTLEMVLTNISDYTYQAYPASVEISIVNVEDAGDAVSVSIDDVSESNTTVTAEGLTRGATYAITAQAHADSAYVTNTDTEVVSVTEGVVLGDVNVLSENYTWSDGWASFPRLATFDLAGGAAGEVSGKFGAMYAPVQCTPIAANAGCDYSYSIVVDFGGFAMDGTLDLLSDGSVVLTENGGGPIAAGTIAGCWVDNGDGTATISYAPANIKS